MAQSKVRVSTSPLVVRKETKQNASKKAPTDKWWESPDIVWVNVDRYWIHASYIVEAVTFWSDIATVCHPWELALSKE